MSVARMAPFAFLALAALAACLPWRIGPGLAFVPQFLPIAVICHSADGMPQRSGAWAIAASGIVVDAVTQGPIGFWALVYLAAYAIATVSHRAWQGGPLLRCCAAAAAIVTAAAVASGVLSFYAWEPLDWRPFVSAAVVAVSLDLAAIAAAALARPRHSLKSEV